MTTTTAKPTPEPNQATIILRQQATQVYHETGLTPRQLADQLAVARAECETVHTNLILADAERKTLADQRAELLATLSEIQIVAWAETEHDVTVDSLLMWLRTITNGVDFAAIARVKAVPK